MNLDWEVSIAFTVSVIQQVSNHSACISPATRGDVLKQCDQTGQIWMLSVGFCLTIMRMVSFDHLCILHDNWRFLTRPDKKQKGREAKQWIPETAAPPWEDPSERGFQHLNNKNHKYYHYQFPGHLNINLMCCNISLPHRSMVIWWCFKVRKGKHCKEWQKRRQERHFFLFFFKNMCQLNR